MSPEKEKYWQSTKWEESWGGPMSRRRTSVQELRKWQAVRGRAGERLSPAHERPKTPG